MTISDYIQKLQRLDMRDVVQQSLYDTREQYLDQQQDQMFAGKLANGEDISPPYAESTKNYKRKKSQPTDRVTLRDTTEFYKRMFVDVRTQVLYVDSAVTYAADLERKYSTLIYGLTGNWKVTFVTYLRTALINQVKNRMM